MSTGQGGATVGWNTMMDCILGPADTSACSDHAIGRAVVGEPTLKDMLPWAFAIVITIILVDQVMRRIWDRYFRRRVESINKTFKV